MPKTITPVSIAFGWNGSKLNSGLNESREAINMLRQNLKASVSDIDRYKNEISVLERNAEKLELSTERLAEAKEYIAKKYRIETDSAKQLREQQEIEARQKRQNEELEHRAAAVKEKNLTQMQRMYREQQRLYEIQHLLSPHDIAAAHERIASAYGIETNAARELREAKESLANKEKVEKDLSERAEAVRARHLTQQQKLNIALHELEQIRNRLTAQQFDAEVERISAAVGIETEAARALRIENERLERVLDRMNRKRQQANGIINSNRTALDEYRRSLARIRQLERDGLIDPRSANMARRTALDEYRKDDPNSFRNRMMPDQRLQAMATFGAPMLAAAGLKKSIELTSMVETAEKSMEVMTGSKNMAKGLVSEMRLLDRESLLSFESIMKGGQTMMGFGVETSKIMPIMRSLSDISMGNSDRMDKLALALGQVRAAGRLAGTEVLQLVNAGFNPLQEMARTTGKSMAQLLQELHDKKITWDMVSEAIRTATAEGGKFHGMTAELEGTLAGSLAKFKSDLEIIGMELGQQIVPGLTQIMQLFRGGGAGESGPLGSFPAWLAGLSSTGLGYIAAMSKDLANFNFEFTSLSKAMEDRAQWFEEQKEKQKDQFAANEVKAFENNVMPEVLKNLGMTQEQFAELYASSSTLQQQVQNQFAKIFGNKEYYRSFSMFSEKMKSLNEEVKNTKLQAELKLISDNDKTVADKLEEINKEKAKLLEKEETNADKILALREMEKNLQLSAGGKNSIQEAIKALQEIDRIEKSRVKEKEFLARKIGSADDIARSVLLDPKSGIANAPLALRNRFGATSMGEFAAFGNRFGDFGKKMDEVKNSFVKMFGKERGGILFKEFEADVKKQGAQYKERVAEASKQVAMDMMTPTDKFGVEMNKLEKMNLDAETRKKAEQQLEQQLFEDTWGSGAQMAPAIQAGTVEAYKYLAQKEQRNEEKKLFKQQLDTQKIMADSLKKMAEIGVALF